MSRTVTTCQAAEPTPASYAPPSPYALSYSLTLPGEPYSAAVARRTVASVLRTHHLDPLVPAAAQAAAELMAAGWHSSPGTDLYLSVRYRDDSLRLIVYDARRARPPPPRRAMRGAPPHEPAGPRRSRPGLAGRVGVRPGPRTRRRYPDLGHAPVPRRRVDAESPRWERGLPSSVAAYGRPTRRWGSSSGRGRQEGRWARGPRWIAVAE